MHLETLFGNCGVPIQLQFVTKLIIPELFLFNRSVLNKIVPNVECIGTLRFILDGFNTTNFKHLQTIICYFQSTHVVVTDIIPDDCNVETLVVKDAKMKQGQISKQTFARELIVQKPTFETGEIGLLALLFPLVKKLCIVGGEFNLCEYVHLETTRPDVCVSYRKVKACDMY